MIVSSTITVSESGRRQPDPSKVHLLQDGCGRIHVWQSLDMISMLPTASWANETSCCSILVQFPVP